MKTIVLMADSKTDAGKQAPASSPAKSTSLDAPPPPPLLWSPLRGTLGAPTEVMVLLGVILALGLVLFGWAFFFRRRSRHSAFGSRSSGVLYEGESRPHGRRRRRSRGSGDLPRNPTLKERGGLPPPREDPSQGSGAAPAAS